MEGRRSKLRREETFGDEGHPSREGDEALVGVLNAKQAPSRLGRMHGRHLKLLSGLIYGVLANLSFLNKN